MAHSGRFAYNSTMSYAVAIVSPEGYVHSLAFQEVAESIHYALLALGYDSVMTTNFDDPTRRYIVFGSNLVSMVPGLTLPANAILFNLEQFSPESTWIEPSLLDLFRSYAVWDYSPVNIGLLAEQGITHVRHVPIGYVPELTRIPQDVPQDIDVLFYGSYNDRRRAILVALEERGVNVQTLFAVYGAERDAMIARSRIVLNLHFFESKIFEIVRVSYLLANGRFVVSERGSDAAHEALYESALAFSEYEDLVDTCIHYLNHEDQRQAIAQAGFNLMRNHLQTEFLKPVLAAYPPH
jgi:hypothetical protein